MSVKERPDMTGNSEKFSSEKEREREKSSWSHLPVTHFLVYRETQHNSVTHRKIMRETQNILRHSESHQQVFTVLESSGIKMRFPFLTKTGSFWPQASNPVSIPRFQTESVYQAF